MIAKQTYTPSAADGPGTVQVVQFRNWDGSSSLSSEPTMHEEAAGTFPAVIEALRALLTGKNQPPARLGAVRQSGCPFVVHTLGVVNRQNRHDGTRR